MVTVVKRNWVIGSLSVFGSIYLGLSLLTYSKWDPSFLTYTPEPVSNLGGIIGAYTADIFMMLIGVSSYAVPLIWAVYGIKGLLLKERHKINAVGSVLFIVSSSALSSLIASSFDMEYPAGIIGSALAGAFKSLIHLAGAYILTLGVLLAALILLSPEWLIGFLLSRKEQKSEVPQTVPEIKEVHAADEYTPPILTDAYALEVHAEETKDASQEEPPQESEVLHIKSKTKYKLPGIDMLSLHDGGGIRPSKEETTAESSLIESKLGDFGVQGRVLHVHVGPIVTMYEFEPAPGVKIQRVVALSDDLALSLKARSVRIAPIPGKAAIGIEVPNRYRETVSLREIISSEGFKKSLSKLTLALGKDIFGNPVVADLTRMPHLLVAGATGSGKSVSMNSMVVSILYKASPEEVKMLLIDPKLLELSSYEGIPHLISPVITSPKEASEALRKMVIEMDRRYRLLAEKRARNIEGFNMAVPPEERMPYIIVCIDELADLMFASASEVEDSIARLAQMARASGIHLILATQRPSVDVITGVIKANFPARISFHLSSKIDSRTILDTHGAEQLIGKGDMLFMLPGARTIRIHGALITEPEINAITSFIKAQGMPDYGILASIAIEEGQKETDIAERDELYAKAVEHAEAIGEVSISSIQRRLKIGYNRAARIMELMEDDGLVGPPKGAGKPRDFIRRRGSL